MTSEADEVLRARLAAAGKRFAAADKTRNEALGKVTEHLKIAHQANVSVAELARLSGLSRVTVYRLLEK